ncbi:MAG: hypothetical protein MJ085_00170 [Clostridia bacterium]|nr:hypothetical protein [Clostridia bacterium]
MCRKTEAIGTAIMSFGAGMLLSIIFSSGVIAAMIGIVCVAAGCLIAKKR